MTKFSWIPLLASITAGCIEDVPFSSDTTTPDTTATSDTTLGSDSGSGDTSRPDGVNADVAPDADIAEPVVTIAPSPVNFGMTTLATEHTRRVDIANAGLVAATIVEIRIADASTGDIWSLRDVDGVELGQGTNPLALPRSLAPGERIQIDVIYENLTGQPSSALLVVELEGADPVTARLIGDTPDEADIRAFCAPDMLSLPDTALGAVAVAPWGKAYIAGAEGPLGVTWRLGEVDLAAPALAPLAAVEDGDFAAMQSDWIRIEGDTVSVYEFYPTGYLYAFNRLSRQVTTSTPSPPPGNDAVLSSRRGDVTWGVRIGQGEGDICDNVCIVGTPDGGDMEVLLDDAGDGYKIHTNNVSWFGGHVYFMAYNYPVSEGVRTRAFLRAHLDTGAVETLVTLDATASNAWVDRPVAGPDGRLYWLRVGHDGQNGRPAEAAIDRFDPSSGDLTAGLVPAIGAAPRALGVANTDTLVWVDAGGIRTAPLSGGQASVLRPLAATTEPQHLYTTIVQDTVWYTHTVRTGDDVVGTFGCVPLDGL